jgi:polygalacturonase
MKYILSLVLIGLVIYANAKEYSIIDFGAKPGETELSTIAIQKAIDACHENGGGIVKIPSGKFVTGSVFLRSNVAIHLEHGAYLLGSPNLEDYPIYPRPEFRSLKDQDGGFRALIYACKQEDIALRGDGTIDGQGTVENFPDRSNDFASRPRLLMFVSCNKLEVSGINLRNSAMWMQHYMNCEDVHLSGLNVYNHSNYNNDMIDIDGCRRVTIDNCLGDTDDDGITFKSTGEAPCENIVVTNCVISSRCNAIKMGTESTGGFKNISISNCVVTPSRVEEGFYGTQEGRSGIALELADGGIMDGISISNITIRGTKVPIYIRLKDRGRPHLKDLPKASPGVLKNILMDNINVTGAGNKCSNISGFPGHPVENIILSNINIQFEKGISEESEINWDPEEHAESYPRPTEFGVVQSCGMFIRHVKNIQIRNFSVSAGSTDIRPPIYAEDVDGLIIRDVVNAIPNSPETLIRVKDVRNEYFEVGPDIDEEAVERL